ncbi:ABC-type branched-chain amino acid transport system, substrate-binding protein [Parafrankia irregularis]|uniref:ABC-type branched-chain amino acid transport system, substrate-binding protein n=1 Tax=Parafrankia irregularis TaxID=795642 RepID=A0A0S4QVJ8_9ACTN|nr:MULTISPECIES: ABC transporter substrate-binding protein [Parafrankia]MBE3205018.1 ABC transporter substrate-binding protein [Parafrankia sp. CH37]CUU58506.1 ABC-type branched-chain amino acid transport system, substrate-binding protein [Parafrankia irregularis]
MTTTLPVALVTPLTGPDAAGGLATLRGMTLWARDERLPPPWDEIAVTAYDAYPDPVRAMRSAAAAEPAAIFGPVGSRAAAAAFGATGRLVFNAGAASTRFVRQSFPHVVNVAAPASTWPRGVLAAIRSVDRQARRVALLASGEMAVELTSVCKAAARAQRFEVTSNVFPAGRGATAARPLPPADVLIVHAGAEDELEIANVLLRRSWRAAAFSTAVSAEATATLGALREGLLAPASWAPDDIAEAGTGPTARQFSADFTALHHAAPTETAAWAYVAGLILGRCIRRCGGVGDTALLAAARGLDTTTLLGRFRLDEATGLQVGHQVPIVQWQSGASWTVWPRDAARAPFHHPRWNAPPPGGLPGGHDTLGARGASGPVGDTGGAPGADAPAGGVPERTLPLPTQGTQTRPFGLGRPRPGLGTGGFGTTQRPS